ncbi:MAG: ATP-binding cassette domain-containing protein, partial [Lachnospiraceae bacterium]
KEMRDVMSAIHTIGLTKYYGKSRGIIDLDLEVEKGDFFGFIGPNGAGKSTTIRILTGLIKSTGGSAKIFGKDVVKEKDKILSKVGYLPSETMFYSGMKVKDILKLSANLRRKDCTEEAKILCERLQLDTEKKIEELSFGNRKKVGIVCALQHNPRLCILDEPTSGLDPLMQREFFDILRGRNEKGTTIFLSSHVLSEIQRNCNRAAIIREGRIIACDSVEALSKTNARRVTVRGKIDLKMLKKVKDIQKSENSISFLYGGDINELLKVLTAGNITDLTVAEPDLEEIFMHYYEDGGDRNDIS